MDLLAIRRILRHHWAFWIFNRFDYIPYPIIALGISLIIFLIGMIFSLLIGKPLTYLQNPPPYLFLIGLALALMAHGWWVQAICRMVVALYSAVEISQEGYREILQRWNCSPLNKVQVIVLAGLPFSLPNLYDVIAVWKSPDPGPIFFHWVHSPRSIFFAIWYGLLHVGATSFVLGSGILGIVATMILIHVILQKPLRLALYRQLEEVSAVGVGLAFWSFIAMAAVALFTRPLLSSSDSYPLAFSTILRVPVALKVDSLMINTLIQTVLSALALLYAFFPPLLMARNSIKTAKLIMRLKFQNVVDRIYNELKELSERMTQPTPPSENLIDKWGVLQKELDAVKSMIKETESIPVWPITILSLTQLFSSALLPIISAKLSSLIFPEL